MAPGDNSIVIRSCRSLQELSACVQLQVDVWGYGDRDVVPRRMFVVAQKIGGQVMGAFDTAQTGAGPAGDAASLVGFAMALPGIADGQPYLHSHMLAVNPAYRNRGIGRRLKLFQREEALARGIGRMEWTFDPLEVKNGFLNIARLGAIVRRYTPDFYGVSSSRIHGEVPTDRLHAEWWLASNRVRATLDGKSIGTPPVTLEITVPYQIAAWRYEPAEQQRVLDVQSNNREQFERAFSEQMAVFGFRLDSQGNGIFQLGPWHHPALAAALLSSL